VDAVLGTLQQTGQGTLGETLSGVPWPGL
jgi:hypothetical protein